jgi:hypothetical protein
MNVQRIAGLAGVTLMSLVGGARGAIVTFDSGTIDDAFTVVQDTAPTAPVTAVYSINSTAGLSGSPAVVPANSGDATALYDLSSFNPTVGTITISSFFKKAAGTAGTQPTLLQLGLASALDTRFNGYNAAGTLTDSFVNVRLRMEGVNGVAFQAQSKAGNTDLASSSTQGATVNLVTDNFYQLVTTFDRTSATQFTVAGSLFNSNADGVVGTLITSLAPTLLTNGDVAGDSTLYAGFRGLGANGLGAVDNFEVTQVPEPASMAVLGLGAMCAFRRRARSAGNA